MSQKQARRKRQAEGGLVRHRKQPTPILESSYIQAPVDYDPVKREYRYRSPKQVRAYLVKRVGAETVDALQEELEALMEAGIPELEEEQESA